MTRARAVGASCLAVTLTALALAPAFLSPALPVAPRPPFMFLRYPCGIPCWARWSATEIDRFTRCEEALSRFGWVPRVPACDGLMTIGDSVLGPGA